VSSGGTSDRQARARAVIRMLWAVVAAEVALAVATVALAGSPAGALWLVAAAITAVIARRVRRDLDAHGADDWRFNWKAFLTRWR
jgi:hypothetical protein